MRFRRSFTRGTKAPREPVSWDRFRVAAAAKNNILNTVAGYTLFDPTAVVQGNQDLRLTMMRLMVDVLYVVGLSGGTAAAGDVYNLGMGIAILGVAEPVPDPLMSTAAAQRTDWLWLSAITLLVPGVPAVFTAANVSRNLQNQLNLVDIKAKRKLDQDQVIKLMFRVDGTEVNQTGHSPGTATVANDTNVSVLYQRTMRRRG